MKIERLTRPVRDADVAGLASLLADAVAGGEAVSFLAPFSHDDAQAWWRATLDGAPDNAIVLVARDEGEIVGTVGLWPSWAPNQAHRAEVTKLIVRQSARRRGVGRALMAAIEAIASESGFTLLTLDAKAGGAADRLYERLGWTRVGIIPAYALDPNANGMHDAAIFYRML